MTEVLSVAGTLLMVFVAMGLLSYWLEWRKHTNQRRHDRQESNRTWLHNTYKGSDSQ